MYIGVCYVVVPRSASSGYTRTKRAPEPVVAVRLPAAFSSRLTLGAARQTHARAHVKTIYFFL